MDNQFIESNQPILETPPQRTWKTIDAWIGLGILILLFAGLALALAQIEWLNQIDSAWLIVIPELFMAVPILIISIWRNISLKELGFISFKSSDLAIGCGLLLAVYFISLINNLIMTWLGVTTQAEVVFEVLNNLDSIILFSISSVILAPIFEESFFRGFLFKGFREKYGWKVSLVLSATIFSLFHGQVATLIPTFLLGALFAYMYQRTESIYPSMILHFLINALGTCGLLAAYQYGVF